MMRSLKRVRERDEPIDAHRPSVRQRVEREPGVAVEILEDDQSEHANAPRWRILDTDIDGKLGCIEQVIVEMHLRENPEQLRAFEIVAWHACFGVGQLMIYIGGVGGTGKSYVVKAILRLFDLLGRRDEIVVGAPTGAAAILIGGNTIHSLAMLPESANRKKSKTEELMHRWRNVSQGRSGRMLFVLLDCKPLYVGGKEMKEDLGTLASEYADLGHKA